MWGGSCDTYIAKVEKIHIDAMRLVTGATARSNIQRLYKETGWQSIHSRCNMAMVIMIFKIKNQWTPNYLFELLPQANAAYISYSLRNNENIKVPCTKREAFRRSFFPTAIRLWNKLQESVRNSQTINILKLSMALVISSNFPDLSLGVFYQET